MKLYIADQTCSRAIQIMPNKISLASALIHYGVFGKSTSNGEDFAVVNPLVTSP
jgi:glutathione S-transferase